MTRKTMNLLRERSLLTEDVNKLTNELVAARMEIEELREQLKNLLQSNARLMLEAQR